jgi:hypothetical protein
MLSPSARFFFARNRPLYEFLMQVPGSSTSDKITFMRFIRDGDTIIEVGAKASATNALTLA